MSTVADQMISIARTRAKSNIRRDGPCVCIVAHEISFLRYGPWATPSDELTSNGQHQKLSRIQMRTCSAFASIG
jgi:hypothetical protein